jgi:hypothetical protein
MATLGLRQGQLRIDAPMVLFHQCMDREWEPGESVERGGWGYESAMAFAALGFVVVRVRTAHWQELPKEAFCRPYMSQDQSMICAIMMRDRTLPFIENLLEQVKEGSMSSDPRTWELDDVTLPTKRAPDNWTVDWDVVGITEASANPSPKCTPAALRS